jgi:hypothetical protein
MSAVATGPSISTPLSRVGGGLPVAEVSGTLVMLERSELAENIRLMTRMKT